MPFNPTSISILTNATNLLQNKGLQNNDVQPWFLIGYLIINQKNGIESLNFANSITVYSGFNENLFDIFYVPLYLVSYIKFFKTSVYSASLIPNLKIDSKVSDWKISIFKLYSKMFLKLLLIACIAITIDNMPQGGKFFLIR